MDLDASAFAERNNKSSDKKTLRRSVVTKNRPLFQCYKVKLYQVKREHVIHNSWTSISSLHMFRQSIYIKLTKFVLIIINAFK